MTSRGHLSKPELSRIRYLPSSTPIIDCLILWTIAGFRDQERSSSPIGPTQVPVDARAAHPQEVHSPQRVGPPEKRKDVEPEEYGSDDCGSEERAAGLNDWKRHWEFGYCTIVLTLCGRQFLSSNIRETCSAFRQNSAGFRTAFSCGGRGTRDLPP